MSAMSCACRCLAMGCGVQIGQGSGVCEDLEALNACYVLTSRY